MVALIPTVEDAQRLAVEDGEPAGQLHLTLFYLGNGGDFDTSQRVQITDLVRVAVGGMPPVAAEAFSVAVFNPTGPEPALVLGIDGPGVDTAHTAVTAALAGWPGGLPEQHCPFCAHVTLRFADDPALLAAYADRVGPLTFDRVRVAFAGQYTDLPLSPPVPEPRAAFGGTFLPSRSHPMPDEQRPIHYGRAYIDTARSFADEPAGTAIPFVASTTGIQRDNLDLRASGWMLNRFAANPVFLWCHDHRSEPIGRVTAHSDGARLLSDVIFDQEDTRAVRIESKYRRGFLSAVSVGWDFVDVQGRALDAWRMSVDQLRDEAFYDLLELSGVPVPADPAALALRQRAALRALGTELVALYDEQESPDSDVTAPELRAAVRAELVRLGIDIDSEPITGELEDIPAGPLVATVDEQALARAIRAAFGDLPLLQVDDREPRHRGAIPSHSTAVVEGSWDGPAAVANCAASKSALRGIHAWVDPDGDADAKASYKFPHHATPGGPANLNGVRNALARLPQANIPEADRAAVERHLRQHLNAQGDSDDDDRAAGGYITWTPLTNTTTTTATTATTLTVRATTNDTPDDEPPTAGVREPADTPVPPTQDSAARAVVDNDAAQVLLAAFTI